MSSWRGRTAAWSIVARARSRRWSPAVILQIPRRPLLAFALTVGAVLAPAAVRALTDLSFIQTQELSTPNGLGNYFGGAVAVDGDTMVVAAPRDYLDPMDDCGYGVAYVYTRQPGSPFWSLTAHLRGDDNGGSFANGDCYGYWNDRLSASIRGDTIAIGAPDHLDDPNDVENYSQGKVYIFTKHLGAWRDATEDQVLTSKHGPPDPFPYTDHFGSAVSLDEDGTTLVVGAPGSISGSGAAYVYQSDPTGHWTEAARLISDTPQQDANFGASLAISGRTVVVGNYHDNDCHLGMTAKIAVFDEPPGGWVDADPTTVIPDVPTGFYSVAIDGDTIVAGRLNDEPASIGCSRTSAAAAVFSRTADGWSQTASLFASDGGGNAPDGLTEFGAVVAIRGDTAVVSAPEGAVAPGDYGEGAAYVFRRPGATWGEPGAPSTIEESQKLVGENARCCGSADIAGYNMAFDGTTIAMGAPFRSQLVTGDLCPQCEGLNTISGGVFVYAQSTDQTAPTTTITRDPATPNGGNGWDRTPPTITVSATDDPGGTGVFQIRCQLDGNAPTAFDQMAEGCAYTSGGPYTVQGLHTLFAAAVDTAGNRSAVVSLAIKLDTVAPSSVISLSPAVPDQADRSYSSPVTVTLSVNADANGSVTAGAHCAVNPATAPATYDDLPDCPTYFFYPGLEYQASGDYTMWVALLDDAGNKEAPHSRSFSIHASPTTTISLTPSTPDGTAGWYRTAVTASVSATPAGTAHVIGLRCVLDPATAPTTFFDIPDACAFAQGGARVTTAGRHTLYAASRDDHGNSSAIVSRAINIDATPPTVTCDGAGPASFLLFEATGAVTATVTDAVSGPSAASASTPLTASDLDHVGNRTKTVTGSDAAGNTASTTCPFSVGYDLGVNTPADGAAFKAGTTVTVTFTLSDATDRTISDASATALLGGKKKPCLIAGLFDGVAQATCPTYNATTDTFSLAIKTPKGRTVVGSHQIGIQVKAPDGTGIVDVTLIPVVLT